MSFAFCNIIYYENVMKIGKKSYFSHFARKLYTLVPHLFLYNYVCHLYMPFHLYQYKSGTRMGTLKKKKRSSIFWQNVITKKMVNTQNLLLWINVWCHDFTYLNYNMRVYCVLLGTHNKVYSRMCSEVPYQCNIKLCAS